MVKRKPPREVASQQIIDVETTELPVIVSSSVVSSPVPPEEEPKEEKKLIFKDAQFQHTSKVNTKKKVWRSLKQIIAQERALPWPRDTQHYSSIEAPPSFRPPKKYSDISGLPAKYTDPQTKLFYALAEEFATVRSLPSDIINGYLTLRGANNPIG
ncbi:INO80 complex subunit C [Nilaparvata lugens]|uniref:INO80 complex subunit C n=1 Tax=Nilaparvata lugens TaxID=108931 RepID=UPI000B990E32|nr:INO80 complex subunit C [Nilaparvata lugens]